MGLPEKLERLFTGSPIWWLRREFEEYRLERCLKRNDEPSFATKRQHERWRDAEFAYLYSRIPSPVLRATVARFQKAGMSEREIRLLVVAGILRSDGILPITRIKEKISYGYGWMLVGICVIRLVDITLLAWTSPAGLLYKSAAVAVGLATYLVCGYLVNCYIIEPCRQIAHARKLGCWPA